MINRDTGIYTQWQFCLGYTLRICFAYYRFPLQKMGVLVGLRLGSKLHWEIAVSCSRRKLSSIITEMFEKRWLRDDRNSDFPSHRFYEPWQNQASSSRTPPAAPDYQPTAPNSSSRRSYPSKTPRVFHPRTTEEVKYSDKRWRWQGIEAGWQHRSSSSSRTLEKNQVNSWGLHSRFGHLQGTWTAGAQKREHGYH